MKQRNSHCMDCGSTNLDTEPRRMLDGVFVYQCKDCGLLFLNRFPLQESPTDAGGMFEQLRTSDFNLPQDERRCEKP